MSGTTAVIDITNIIEAPDGSTTGRIDMAELHKLNAEVRALIRSKESVTKQKIGEGKP